MTHRFTTETLRRRTDSLATDELTINFGPQHPSTHGVLRLEVKANGEVITCVDSHLGYLHRGIEKNLESKEFLQGIPLLDRADYLSSMFNSYIMTACAEELAEIEPTKRAEWIRVIMMELNRISSHLLWWGTFLLDLGATTPMFYAFREREDICDMFELVTGARLLFNYIRPGGVRADVTPEFMKRLAKFTETFPKYMDEYEELVTGNAIFVERVTSVGVMSAERAINWGLSGPMLRGSGVAWDLRIDEPYCAYPDFTFDRAVDSGCDVMARYRVRMMEMRQSNRILKQAVEGLPEGPYTAKVPVSIKCKQGMTYRRIESPRGELGGFMVTSEDKAKKPWRFHLRAPSFVNLSAIEELTLGYMIGDLIAILGGVDIVLGDVDR
ncbi:MAG: NADH-quinone oxidoreductase subunit D [bacterium]|jgi:NADH-quinone oxidoreductase subunit D